MTLYKIKVASVILILFMAGCREKDDLTLPVKVYFKIGISPENSLNTEYLHFTDCKIGIQRIQFEGKREAGTDIFFETDPNMNLQTLSFAQQPLTISVFNIPQGIYNYCGVLK
jgi:hypothetical protein